MCKYIYIYATNIIVHMCMYIYIYIYIDDFVQIHIAIVIKHVYRNTIAMSQMRFPSPSPRKDPPRWGSRCP